MGLFSSSSSSDQEQYSTGSQTQQGPASAVQFKQGKNSTGSVNVSLTDHGAVGAALALGSQAVAANERSYIASLQFADAETDDAIEAVERSRDAALQFGAGAFTSALSAADSAYSSSLGAVGGAYYSSLNAVGGAYASGMSATQSATDRAIAAILATSGRASEEQKIAYQDSLAVLGAATEAARQDLEARQDRSLKDVAKVAALGVGAVALFSWLA